MFDSGIIGPLYVVAVLCRNPKIRRKALNLLETNPRREGVWDSILGAKAAIVIMNIEEEGMEGDYIPEHSRLRGIKLTSDLQQRTGRLQHFIEAGRGWGFPCPPGRLFLVICQRRMGFCSSLTVLVDVRWRRTNHHEESVLVISTNA
jgi:hypothetical protein